MRGVNYLYGEYGEDRRGGQQSQLACARGSARVSVRVSVGIWEGIAASHARGWARYREAKTTPGCDSAELYSAVFSYS